MQLSSAYEPQHENVARSVAACRIHCVSKNVSPLQLAIIFTYSSIATIFGTNVAEKVGSQNVLYFPTTPN